MARIEHTSRNKESKTSSTDKTTLYKTAFYKATGITFSGHEDFYTDTGLLINTYTNIDTPDEGIPDYKETLFGSQKTSLEYNHDSLNETASSPTPPSTQDDNFEYVTDRLHGHNETPTATL